MTSSNLLGIFSDELNDAERALQDELLLDPEHLLEHREALELGQALRGRTLSGGPSALDVLRLARAAEDAPPKWTPFWSGTLLALAATLLGTVLLQAEPTQRTRGGSSVEHIELQAVLDGTLRTLHSGDSVSLATDAVVFQVRASAAGTVSITEFGRQTTLVQQWSIEAGTSVLGESSPLAWTPNDANPGLRRYLVQWCPSDVAPTTGGRTCVEDKLSLHWRP